MSSLIEIRKRSLKLRSRLKRNLQRNATNEFVNQLECRTIKLSFATDKWCHIIEDFLTQKECSSFINFLYKNSPNQMKQRKERKGMKGSSFPRGLSWTINKSETITALLFERCFHFLPKIWIDENDMIWEISGINDDIKSLRYGVGDVLYAHYDTPYIKSKRERSFITVVLYLNDDFVGGCFQFVDPMKKGRMYPIPIKSGTCLLFQHNLFHQGSVIQERTKYIIRLDILYRKVVQSLSENTSCSNEKKSSCIWL